MYVDYLYYKERGTLTETEFNQVIEQAEMTYDNYTRKQAFTNKILEEDGKFAKIIKLTICELADNIHRYKQMDITQSDNAYLKGVTSESVKDHSVTFASDVSPKVKLEKELAQENARLMKEYLSQTGLLYRGL